LNYRVYAGIDFVRNQTVGPPEALTGNYDRVLYIPRDIRSATGRQVRMNIYRLSHIACLLELVDGAKRYVAFEHSQTFDVGYPYPLYAESNDAGHEA
jgi:hypothetical protein